MLKIAISLTAGLSTAAATALRGSRSPLPGYNMLTSLAPAERDSYLKSLTGAFSASFGKDLVTVPNQKCVSRRACHPALYGDNICLVESAKAPKDFCQEKRGAGTFFLAPENVSAWMRLQLKAAVLCMKNPGSCEKLRAVPEPKAAT